ncbi:NHL repeat-containing protein [Conexibacter woesei]|uniref:NHL repeat containing protein n=1 Tax=Conexibacter woesei (strain DSM 14684 / CCUG 47730 / CIP 108061 / JCM 11494 / NBRC 100937 / ID131577) TaxID=469383 RepID=D3F7U0_CONWI|nr:NHL repeat-containing protein [Conexibacter woesei]ADB52834.1 NHL repeat containing protein [Conexibacter woesei DSM 14684]
MTWNEQWVAAGVALYGDDAWAHHDLAVTADQRIVGFRSGGDRFWILDADGRAVGEFASGLGEGHGLTIAGPAGAQELWVADPGITFARDAQGVHDAVVPSAHGRVVAVGLDGDLIAELPTPATPVYESEVYRPTTVMVDDAGDGTVWVADGYGAELVHHLSRDGELLLTLTGEEGAGRFDCPHGLLIDRRRPERPQLYVTDRGNDRIVVYDLDGTFLRAVDEGLRAPSGLALRGEELVVAELEARLTILDCDDRVVERIGDDPQATARPGWPNALDADGRTVRPELPHGRFNSPHGLAVDAAGRIYVAEWVLGGRIVRVG